MPAEEREEIHHRFGQISFGAVFEDVFRAITLPELLRAFSTEDDRHSRDGRPLYLQRVVEREEFWRRRDEFFSAYDVRYLHLIIVDDVREIIGRIPVGLDKYEIVERLLARGKL